jgi:hypothetical protein
MTMATERVTERDDGVTRERVTEAGRADTVVVERRGGGFGAVLGAIALVVLIAIVAVFLLNQNRQGDVQTAAISDAAENVSSAATDAASSVSGAAERAADSVQR